jgi:hypothetical protein
VEADEVDVLPFSMLRDFEEIDQAEEARLAGEVGCDVGQTDGGDGIDFDLAVFHCVPISDFDVGPGPEADTARDLAGSDAVAEAFGEDHIHSQLREFVWGEFDLTQNFANQRTCEIDPRRRRDIR